MTCLLSFSSTVPFWLIGVVVTIVFIAPTAWYYSSCRHRKKDVPPQTTVKDEPVDQKNQEKEDKIKWEMEATQWTSM